MSEPIVIGVIGGSGLYNMAELSAIERHSISTPFGAPSGDVVIGTLRGKRVAFLPRHGEGHRLTPTEIPYRANIYALKRLGVRYIIGVNACGSLREGYAPGHVVVPHQIVDVTTSRPRTFFEQGIVAHVSVADPFDVYLRGVLAQSIRDVGGTAHDGGTFLIEEGPRFATRAESHLFRAWNCDIIGMTTAPEVFLAREAEIAYATMAHITDYDSWHEHEAAVTVETVVATFRANIRLAEQALARAVERLDETTVCPAHSALDGAIMTHAEAIAPAAIERLRPILQRTLKLA